MEFRLTVNITMMNFWMMSTSIPVNLLKSNLLKSMNRILGGKNGDFSHRFKFRCRSSSSFTMAMIKMMPKTQPSLRTLTSQPPSSPGWLRLRQMSMRPTRASWTRSSRLKRHTSWLSGQTWIIAWWKLLRTCHWWTSWPRTSCPTCRCVTWSRCPWTWRYSPRKGPQTMPMPKSWEIRYGCIL